MTEIKLMPTRVIDGAIYMRPKMREYRQGARDGRLKRHATRGHLFLPWGRR